MDSVPLYFTIDFTDKEHVNPFINLAKALVIWIIFHFFTHMDIIPTIITILLVMVLFFISNYRHYLSKINSRNKNIMFKKIILFLIQKIIF